MPGAIALHLQIVRIVGVGWKLVRHTLRHCHTGGHEPGHFGGIIGEQTDTVLPEQPQHGSSDPEIARVHREAEPQVGFDRVIALVLQRIGA